MEGKREEKIGEALMKVALGYQIAEVTEEYAEVDGALKLTKRKKTKKDVPPDLKAVQMLLEKNDYSEEYSGLSDEELEREKERLLQLLKSGLQEQMMGDGYELKAGLSGTDALGGVAIAAPKKSVRKRSVVKKSVAKKTVAKKKAVKKEKTK